MSGRRLGSYRKGDWNEELGILLLKSLAAIAPVPRQEDFGLDAVGTLLRPDQNNFVYAEDSFYIQQGLSRVLINTNSQNGTK